MRKKLPPIIGRWKNGKLTFEDPAFEPRVIHRRRPAFKARRYYRRYLKTQHWHIVVSRAKQLADHKCQVCSSEEELEVHHNNYEHMWAERTCDVVVMCGKCHKLYHE